MRTFKSLEAVRDATLEQLANAPSMNAKSAQQVYDFFHAKQGADTVDVTEV
jgi:excinuclease ABC subunit C